MRKWIIAAFLIAGLAGCASTPEETTTTDQAATTTTTPSTGATTQGATTQGVGGSGITGSTAGGGIPSSALKDPRNILSKRNIYFDYDQFTVKDEYRPIVEAHAKYLQSNRSARAILQGHTDERGTREYNIALGQKRADAVRTFLIDHGVPENRIRAEGVASNQPIADNKTTGGRATNRRVEIILQK